MSAKLNNYVVSVSHNRNTKSYDIRAKNRFNAGSNAYDKFCDEFNSGKDLDETKDAVEVRVESKES